MASIKRHERQKGAVWLVRVRTPGRRTVTKTFASKRDAERWAALMEGEKVSAGLPPQMRASRATFGQFAESWLGDRPLALRTAELYRDLLDRFLLPTFAPMRLDRIGPELVRNWHSKMVAADRRAGRGPSTTAKAYRLLRAIFATAVRDGMLGRNPCQIDGAGLERPAERPLVEPAQVFALAEAIEPRLRALVLLAAFGGLRRGELLALRRGDIDLDAGTVRVERQAVRTGSRKRVETPPKSHAGRRTRPLPPFLVDEMRRHMATYTGEGDEAHIFTGVRGGPLSAPLLTVRWHAAREAVGLDRVTIHDLRHAAGTMLAWQGATQRELMAHLGHSSPAAAMRYQHAAQSRAVEMANRLDDLAMTAAAENRDKSATKETGPEAAGGSPEG